MYESPVDPTAPVMLAWNAFQSTDAYENAKRWAVSPRDTEGSLWCAFLAGHTAASATPDAAEPAKGAEAALTRLRDAGWAVAVHNDYRLGGEPHTFWLLTRDGRYVKGEGRTDAIALAQCERASEPAPPAGAEVVHASPEIGAAVMPCCGVSPFEVPMTDRVTVYPELVTCRKRSAVAEVREAAEAAYAAWLMTVPIAFGDAMARLGAALRGGQKGGA